MTWDICEKKWWLRYRAVHATKSQRAQFHFCGEQHCIKFKLIFENKKRAAIPRQTGPMRSLGPNLWSFENGKEKLRLHLSGAAI